VLEALGSWLSLFDFSALATELFGRPIGTIAATLLVAGALATGSIALFGLYYARKRFIVAHRELALKEDAAAKKLPIASVTIFNEDNVDSIVYLVPFDRRTLFSLPLVVGLRNDSNVEFKNLIVLLRMNADAYGYEYVTRQPGSIAQAFGFQRFEQDEDGTKLVVALSKIARLPPEMTYNIEDFIFTSSSTILEGMIEADALDGKVKFNYRAEVSLHITLNVQGENIGANAKTVSISFIQPPNEPVEEFFKAMYSEIEESEKKGRTVIVSFDGREENREFSEMTKDFRRDLQLYRRNKKAGLRKLKEHYGSEVSDNEIARIIEHGTRETLVSLSGRKVAVMNRRYP
jgi:hypothetical protein